jgi:glycosyltransferase involved in cell wall biosynthesis
MARFSIVMPVLNGGEYVKESVGCVLAQTVTDFNLHILDSGSTDGTLEWIASLNDSRIIVHTSNVLLTIQQNWARMKTIPRNEWMSIVCADDNIYPNYLEVMQSQIDDNPDAALFGTHFDFIDKDGAFISTMTAMGEHFTIYDFAEKLITNEVGVVCMMLRSADFDTMGGVPEFPNFLFADFPLYIELAKLSGKVIISPKVCLAYRLHNLSTTKSSVNETYYLAFDRYLHYLNTLKNEDERFGSVINKTGKNLLQKRGIEFVNKVLHTPPAERKSYKKINSLVQKHNEYSDLLIREQQFKLENLKAVKIAKLIDKTWLTRNLFIEFKKRYKKPILSSD